MRCEETSPKQDDFLRFCPFVSQSVQMQKYSVYSNPKQILTLEKVEKSRCLGFLLDMWQIKSERPWKEKSIIAEYTCHDQGITSELDGWRRFNKTPIVVQHTGLILKRAREWKIWIHDNTQMCSHLCAGICMHTPCTYVSLCPSCLLFSHPLSVSLSGHLCAFPLHGNLPACLQPPPLTILCAAKWLLSSYCLQQRIYITLCVCFVHSLLSGCVWVEDAESWKASVSENGSIVN